MTYEQTNAVRRRASERACIPSRVLNNQRGGIVDAVPRRYVRILPAELDEQIALVADIEDTRRSILRIYWGMAERRRERATGARRTSSNPGIRRENAVRPRARKPLSLTAFCSD